MSSLMLYIRVGTLFAYKRDTCESVKFQVYSIPSAYVHMILGNQYNSYNLCQRTRMSPH